MYESNNEEKLKLEEKVRQQVRRLFIEEAELEKKAKEQREKSVKEKKEAKIIKIPPREEQLELDLEALQARAKLEERIKREKRKGKRIIQGISISSAIIILAIAAVLNTQRGTVQHYDLVEIKDRLQSLTSYYGQFEVEDVILADRTPFATLNLGFSPSTESDFKDFVESLVKRYSLVHPGERIDLLLKNDQRIYAKASYAPHTNFIDIEIMK